MFKHYFLIHGAWHNSSCWWKFAPLLQAKGHSVLTPDLPGHGKNMVAHCHINLKSYVDYIIDLIQKQKEPVILVGHSMAGIVISQVAEVIPQQIDQLIYLSAFIPKNRSSITQELKFFKHPTISNEVIIDEANNEVKLKTSDQLRKYFYNNCSDEEAKNSVSELQTEPLRPLIEPIQITEHNFGSVKKIYIECLQDQIINIEDQRRMHSRVNCQVKSLNSDHSPFLSAPDELLQKLLP